MSLFFCFVLLLLTASVEALNIGSVSIAPCSSFAIIKAVTTFRCLDNNNDGFLIENDIHAGADDFAKAVHLNEAENKTLQEDSVPTIWRSLRIDEGRESQPVTEAQYIDLFCKRQKTRSNESQDRIAFTEIFRAADRNHDGSVDVNEYIGLMVVFKVDEHLARAAFMALDKDGDGRLSEDDYVNYCIDFLNGYDASSISQLLVGLNPGNIIGL